MFDIARRRVFAFRWWVRDRRYRAGCRLARWRRAWRYAREELADHPDLPRLIADGCARVGDKWESYNDELWEARRWAIGLAKEYAVDEGITLTTLDDERESSN